MASNRPSGSTLTDNALFWAIVAVVIIFGVFGSGSLEKGSFSLPTFGADDQSASSPAWTADTELTAERVESLTVAAPEQSGSYDRDTFGAAWADVDGNGCDTRNDMLVRDLQEAKIDSDGCTVLAGSMVDPYTGETIAFTRDSSGGGIDIDHLRSLSDAWSAGAHSWTPEQRLAYANDPAVLLASDASENSSKSDKGPSEWMPRGRAAQCAYGAQYASISEKYELTVSRADFQTLSALAKGCSD